MATGKRDTAARIPTHVAVLMDGSTAWAEERGQTRLEGYEAAVRAALTAVRVMRERGVRHLTLFAPDLASRSHPYDANDPLTQMLVRVASEEAPALAAAGVAVRVLGDSDGLPVLARRAVEKLVSDTRGGRNMTLWLALSYGARRDVAEAARVLAARVRCGLMLPEEIDEHSVRAAMTTAELPDADLVIRTGGAPLGDFLLLESAHAEHSLTDLAWPDVDATVLVEALDWFGRRRDHASRPSPRAARAARTGTRSARAGRASPGKLDETNERLQRR